MPRLPKGIRRALTLPVVHTRAAEFLFRRADASGDIYPEDSPSGSVLGPDPDRILFLGERGQMTLGVRTHALSLPAFLARQLAKRTQRGVTWSITDLPQSRLQHAPRIIETLEPKLRSVDVVVILVGITDTLRATSAAAWQEHLQGTLQALNGRLSKDARILVADIPPLDNAGSLSRPARVAAGIHGRTLNRRSRAVLADCPRSTAVPFPEELTESLWLPESVENRYTHTYRVWGAHLADAVVHSD